MILKNNFFLVNKHCEIDGKDQFDIELNPEHFIFKAHFPGNPIVPGVCQVKMVSELLDERLGRHAVLTGVKNIKYLYIMTPTKQTCYSVTFDKLSVVDDVCKLTVTYSDTESTYAKLSLNYKL